MKATNYLVIGAVAATALAGTLAYASLSIGVEV